MRSNHSSFPWIGLLGDKAADFGIPYRVASRHAIHVSRRQRQCLIMPALECDIWLFGHPAMAGACRRKMPAYISYHHFVRHFAFSLHFSSFYIIIQSASEVAAREYEISAAFFITLSCGRRIQRNEITLSAPVSKILNCRQSIPPCVAAKISPSARANRLAHSITN